MLLEHAYCIPFPIVGSIGQILLHGQQSFLQAGPVDGPPDRGHICIGYLSLRLYRTKQHGNRAVIRTLRVSMKFDALNKR